VRKYILLTFEPQYRPIVHNGTQKHTVSYIAAHATVYRHCGAIPRNVMTSSAMYCYTMIYNAKQVHTMPYNTVKWYSLLCTAIQCHTMPYNGI